MKKKRPTIVVNKNTPQAVETFSTVGKVRALDSHEVTRESVKDADVLVVRSETRVDRQLLEGSPVRFVGTVTIGTDHVDVDYLTSRGITFASAPGCNASSVAEYIAAALLDWSSRTGEPLSGKTIGVVGVGNVGTKVMRVARVLGMIPILNDPPLARSTGDASYRPLDELMDADVISLHVPLTKTGEDATFHFFDRQQLARMKPGTLLINTARGAVIDSAALSSYLSSHPASKAILDVWEGEPTIDTGLVDRVMIATPHIAGHSLDGKLNGLRMIYDAVCRYFQTSPDAGTIDYSANDLKIKLPDRLSIGKEDLVRLVVEQAYDILIDDNLLRSLKRLPEPERADHFAGLRATYRVRREFHNWVVYLRKNQQRASEILAGLGFSVRIEKEQDA